MPWVDCRAVVINTSMLSAYWKDVEGRLNVKFTKEGGGGTMRFEFDGGCEQVIDKLARTVGLEDG